MKVEQKNFVRHLIITTVLDPDLEIRWGGGEAHPDPYIRGGAVFDPQFGLKLYSTITLLNISEPIC